MKTSHSESEDKNDSKRASELEGEGESERNPWPASMQLAGRPSSGREPNDQDIQTRWDAPELVSVLSDRYEIFEWIKKGRTSAVLRAQNKRHGVTVKLKIVSPRFQNAAERDLLAVIAALQQIGSRFIVEIRDCFVLPDGTTVLECEWIDGTSLHDRIVAAGGPISEPTVLRWMEHVCEGMTGSAAADIVHRNLKPANILIDSTDTARIDNWEWATFSGVRTGPVGTPQYMPAEQQEQFASIDARSDIYSYGATFYHALNGEPFNDAAGRLLPRVQPAADSSTTLHYLSAATTGLLRRCLASRPQDRFQSFVELRTRLESPDHPKSMSGTPPELPGYQILSFLGQGGMGTVYKARSLDNDQLVALKFMRSIERIDLELLARFRIEAEAVACLRHENIVPVLEVGAYGGYPYLALEYVAGENLKEAMSGAVPCPLSAARIAAGVARGLHHSHRLGILHRDLKPQNILLSSDGIPRITDFGLAKFLVTGKNRTRLRSASILPGIRGSLQELDRFAADDKLSDRVAESARNAMAKCGPQVADAITEKVVREFVMNTLEASYAEDTESFDHEPTKEGDLLGTPAYMAPEQTIGDLGSIGPRTDIFAFGVVFYELLCGQQPFSGRSLSELFDHIRNRAPKPMSHDVPSTLSAICLRCLSKNADDRFSSAASIVEELEQFLASANAAQADPRRWWQLWKRNR